MCYHVSFDAGLKQTVLLRFLATGDSTNSLILSVLNEIPDLNKANITGALNMPQKTRQKSVLVY